MIQMIFDIMYHIFQYTVHPLLYPDVGFFGRKLTLEVSINFMAVVPAVCIMLYGL